MVHNRKKKSMRGGDGIIPSPWSSAPFVGSPYNAAAADLPVGKYLPISPVGIPSGALDSPLPSNWQLGGSKRRRSRKRSAKKSKRRSSKKSKRRSSKSKRRSSKSKRRSSKSKRRSSSKRMRGGNMSDIKSYLSAVLPDDLVNAGRSVPAAFGHFADKFNGVISSPSSMVYPTQQPLVAQVTGSNALTPPDIKAMYSSAVGSVAAM